MSIRNFGPSKGAGVAVRERDAALPIVPSQLGTACLIGIFEKGKANGLTYAPDQKRFAQRLGGRVLEDATTGASVVPDCAQDYWLHGAGAGSLVCLRVTDGLEQAADVKIYSRGWGTAFPAVVGDKDNQSQVKIPLIQIKAQNGGRWGGRIRKRRATVSAIGKITATTLDTETVMATDEWKGATLTLDCVSGKTYKVLSNTAAGMLTVETGATMSTDRGSAVDPGYFLDLPIKTETTGVRKALSVKVIQATIDPANEFGLEINVDGDLRLRYPDLSMDSTSARYFKTVINDDQLNFDVTAVDLWNGSTPLNADVRPANFYGMPTAVDTTSLSFLPMQVTTVEDAAVAVVGATFDSSYLGLPIKLTLTWNLVGTKYLVTATGIGGQSTVTNLPDFTVGAAEQINKIYNPGSTHANWLKYVPKLTIDHNGGAPADAKKIIVEILPLPSTCVGGLLLPDAKNKPLSTLRVSAATFKSVTCDGDPSVLGLAPTQASVTGTADGAAGYAIVLGASDSFKVQVDGRKAVTVTLTAGIARTPAQICTDINGAFDAVFGAGVLNPASVIAVGAVLRVKLASTWYEGGGKASSIAIQTVANDAYTVLGFTVAVTQGVNGREAQLAFASECSGGYDGAAPADAAYLTALSIGASPINKVPHSKGVLLMACPDVTSTAVQQAGMAYAAAKAHDYEVLIPSNKLTEQDAVDYVNVTIGRGEDASTHFPSYGSVTNPDKAGSLKSLPLVGAVFGLDAKYAGSNGHYCAPAAGVGAELTRVVKLATDDAILDGEVLNPQGLNVIKFRGTVAIVWGARTLAGSTGEVFRSKRLQLSHYVHTLLDQFDYVVFSLNDPLTRADLKTALRTFFLAEWKKRALRGNKFEDACQIKIDDENNTSADEAAGDLIAEITLQLTGFAERVIFTIGKAGLVENVSA